MYHCPALQLPDGKGTDNYALTFPALNCPLEEQFQSLLKYTL